MRQVPKVRRWFACEWRVNTKYSVCISSVYEAHTSILVYFILHPRRRSATGGALHKNSNLGEWRAISTVPRAQRPDAITVPRAQRPDATTVPRAQRPDATTVPRAQRPDGITAVPNTHPTLPTSA